MEMENCIAMACDEMKAFLIEKNRSYGNSVADPIRAFACADPIEQINVRIDDKLSRIIRGDKFPGDNDEKDLAGYLVLKQAVKMWLNAKKKSLFSMPSPKNQFQTNDISQP